MELDNILFQGFVMPMMQISFIICIICICTALFVDSKENKTLCLQIMALIGGVWLSAFAVAGFIGWFTYPCGIVLLVAFGYGFKKSKGSNFRKKG